MDREALKREYKQTRRLMGVYQVRNTIHNRSLVGSTTDLPAIVNRQRAQLSMGAHANRALQKDWDELGSEAFEFEVLDELTPDAGYGPHPSPFSRVERKMPGNSRN